MERTPIKMQSYLNSPDLERKTKYIVKILHGALSYNNLADTTAAYKILCELEDYNKSILCNYKAWKSVWSSN